MIVLGLLTCVLLRAFSAQAKVVDSFEECKDFFYKGTEPRGMDQNAKKICQKLEFDDHYYHYATLYSVHHRIPLYSAYIFDSSCLDTAGRTEQNWHVEPQISMPESRYEHMVREYQMEVGQLINIKRHQALSMDYSDTGYDRGHLNPNSFQCSEGRMATFTLTNAAPMDACFNRIHWKNWESTLRTFLSQMLNRDDPATAYLVTGTVPDGDVRIPQREDPILSKRVTVPSHIWTAVCYKNHINEEKSFSFGYIGKNLPEGGIRLMPIEQLENQLSELYSEYLKTAQPITIFADQCFSDKNNLDEVRPAFQKLINLQVSRAVSTNKDIQNTFKTVKRALRGDTIFANNVKVSKLSAELAFDNMDTYVTVTEDLKRSTGISCLLTYVKSQALQSVHHEFVHDELRKREVSGSSDAVKCQLVPEKITAPDGSPCSLGSSTVCNTAEVGAGLLRCSTPCLYHDHFKGFRCYRGQIVLKCSPPYSLITAPPGARCMDEFPCATYGSDHYWCKTTSGYIDYCSPPLWGSKAKNGEYCRSNHACANYGYRYKWCYTDTKGTYDKCCTLDDCYSAVNDKTCRSDHRCGYHGYDYLWCYTDANDNWDYCCKNCD